MAVCGKRRGWTTAAFGLGALLGAVLGGCSKQGDPPAPAKPEGPAALTATNPGPAAGPIGEARWQQPFGEATITDPPPPDQRLPDKTLAGKSVGKLFLDVTKVWNDIRFVAPSGKRLSYQVTIETELGPIEIALRPDLAPNHVRNFLALAKAGYYDGLVFERTVHAESDANPDSKLDLIEAGCPLGTGEPGFGSIGYWLPRELAEVAHEAGTVGAMHEEDPDTAACKFYITLSKAPVLDGEFTVFGKVSRGLDVARRILTQPVRNDMDSPQGDRPLHPIAIRKVTIQAQETDQ